MGTFWVSLFFFFSHFPLFTRVGAAFAPSSFYVVSWALFFFFFLNTSSILPCCFFFFLFFLLMLVTRAATGPALAWFVKWRESERVLTYQRVLPPSLSFFLAAALLIWVHVCFVFLRGWVFANRVFQVSLLASLRVVVSLRFFFFFCRTLHQQTRLAWREGV